MLRRLLITDFVLVDRLELEFQSGFGALTGETGAGKSILLDALSLLLGERADAGVVRAGCDKADLAAEFDLPADSAARDWLLGQDFAADDDLLIRRVVDSNGRSRAYINGMPATATQLRELGAFIADIHGQHAHQALLRSDAQRQLLDSYGGHTALAREVAGLWRELAEVRRAREEANRQQASLQREQDMLAFQVKELDELAFTLGEWEPLNQEHARLTHAASLIEGVSSSLDAIAEGEQPLAGETERLAVRLTELAQYDASLRDVAELLNEAAIRLGEAGHALSRYRDRIELDPDRLIEIEQRLSAVIGMSRKYRVTPEELPELQANSRAQLESLNALADPAALAEREAKCEARFRERAGVLSRQRARTAQELGKQVSAAMQDLALSGGSFEIAMQADPEGTASGLEKIEFLVAANPGQPLKPLAKVASGGELSRIGLSIQVIASASQSVPTLIFDEVDVGIGGRVAEMVGRRLRELGASRQVLCVTHLPQVAAQANWQWRVAKDSQGGTTLSRLDVLDEAGRIEEIARMLGGVNITDTTRSHAAELLGLNA